MKHLCLILVSVMVSIAIAKNNRLNPEFITTKAGGQFYTEDRNRNHRSIIPGDDYQKPHPHRDPIEGERFQVGDTWYDYQTNGSLGKVIFKDHLGAIQLIWMDGEDADLGNSPRSVKYNFSADDGENWTYDDGNPINDQPHGGYGSMWLMNEDEPRAVFFFHQGFDRNLSSYCGIDFIYGNGTPDNVRLPRNPEQTVLWSQGVISPENRIHVVCNSRNTDMLSYVPGIFDRHGNPAFEENPIELEHIFLNSYRIAQSPNSERAAMVWLNNRIGFEDPGPWEGYLAYQMNNDISIVWTDDGEDWNFDEPRNITFGIPPDPRQEGSASYGDTLRPFRTMDIIFDEDDFIHVVFDTRLFKEQAIHENRPPVDEISLAKGFLFHWSEETDEITPVANGWWDHNLRDDEGRITRHINPGYWSESTVCRPSLAYADNGDLYCVYTIYPRDDYSVNNYCNGDIAVTVSEDNGATWYEPTMITTTRTLEAEEGESESEVYPCLAFEIDDFLHISYELDTEPGSPLNDYPSREEILSLCQWYYHKIPIDAVERNAIFEGPPFHINQRPIIGDVARERGVPITNEPVQVTSTVDPHGDRELVSVRLEYVIDGNLEDITIVDMNNDEENIFTAEIPGQEDGTYVWYRIRAIDSEEMESLRPESWWYSYVVRPEGELLIHDIQYRPPEWTTNDYSPYKDIEVTVTGIVTTPEDFAEEYGGYAIQEADSFWSGVVIRNVDDLHYGDVVTVTGTVRERDEDEYSKWCNMTYIDVVNVERRGNEEPPRSIEVEIRDLNFNTHAEHLEGMVIRLEWFKIDTIDVAPDFEGIYLPITDAGEEIENESWMTTYGLTEDVRDDVGFEVLDQGWTITWLVGVFVENQEYAIAPRFWQDFGRFIPAHVDDGSSVIPQQLSLDPAYPNPFNSITKLGFNLPVKSDVYLGVYDLTGRLVTAIIDGERKAGYYQTNFNAANVSSGIYILQLETEHSSVSQKLVLVK